MAKPSLLIESFFIFFIFTPLYSPSLGCPIYQKEALLQFKSIVAANLKINYTSLTAFESWNSSSNCCQWNRVTCHSHVASNQVTGLNLYHFIPSDTVILLPSDVLIPLFYIRTLMSLNISYNWIHGEILGTGFANLTKLVSLDMSVNNFNGYIPLQLFSLKYLEYLDLSSNWIEGTVGDNLGDPRDLKQLKLRTLLLQGNHISGVIPLLMFHLKELEVLNLGFNILSMEIPAEIGNMLNLSTLVLSGNRLTGGIPSSIYKMSKLETLQLDNNLLFGEIPVDIGNIMNLSTLVLSENHLTGGIPSSIQKMSKLETLQLDNNLLSGEIPTFLFEFKMMKNLDLGGNKLTWKNVSMVPKSMFSKLSLKSCNVLGHIPHWLSKQTNLYFLDLSENQLEGSFPQWLAELDLTFLTLSDNRLSSSLPSRLFQSKNLTVLDLSRNNFSGQLPDNIGEATKIIVLKLSDNNFSGLMPKSLSNIQLLGWLDLSRNRFSGNEFPIFNPKTLLVHVDLSFNRFFGGVPVTFGPWTTTLILSHNEFSGPLPQNLTNLRDLKRLDLHDNYITGDIPTFFSQMSSLEVLNLRSNFLEGSIPGDLSNLTYLRILDLSNNNLNGQIPPSLGNFIGMIEYSRESPDYVLFSEDELDFMHGHDWEVSWKKQMQGLSSNNLYMYTFLDLSKNQLSGEIPVSLGGLKNLKALNMSYNNFLGNIPSSFGDLQSLESLDLSHNNLFGDIPQTFSKLLELTILDLSNNKLIGRIPEGSQMDRLNDPNSYANNSGLCGMQIREPCQEVPPPPKPQESASREIWFSLEMAGIGYPFGVVTTILVMYCIGYFEVAPRRHQRHRVRTRL